MLTSGGTTIAICASSPTAFTAAGYQALTFTDIDGVSDIGPIGRAFGTTSYNPLSSRDPVTVKGNVADTTSNLQWAYVPGDPGQEMLEEAVEDVSSAYSFRLTWPNGRVRYFQALVLGTPITTGNADTLLGSTTTLFVRSATIATTPPPSTVPQVPLELSAYSFVAGSPLNTIIAQVLNVPVAATVALSDSHGGAVKLIGLDLVVGPTVAGEGVFEITLQLYPADGSAPTPTTLEVTALPTPGGLNFSISDNAVLLGAI